MKHDVGLELDHFVSNDDLHGRGFGSGTVWEHLVTREAMIG
jgi:hypothetical protein